LRVDDAPAGVQLGHRGAEYDAWLIRIGEGDQFGSGFVAIGNECVDAQIERRAAREALPDWRAVSTIS